MQLIIFFSKIKVTSYKIKAISKRIKKKLVWSKEVIELSLYIYRPFIKRLITLRLWSFD